jgi:hypothetical protein
MIKPGSLQDMDLMGWSCKDPFWHGCAIACWHDPRMLAWPRDPHAPQEVPPGAQVHIQSIQEHMISVPHGISGVMRCSPGRVAVITGMNGSDTSRLVAQIMDSMSMVRPMILWERSGRNRFVHHEGWSSAYAHHRYIGGDDIPMIETIIRTSRHGTMVVMDGLDAGNLGPLTRPLCDRGLTVIAAGPINVWNGIHGRDMRQDGSIQTVAALRNPWCSHAPLMQMPEGHAVMVSGAAIDRMHASDVQYVDVWTSGFDREGVYSPSPRAPSIS